MITSNFRKRIQNLQYKSAQAIFIGKEKKKRKTRKKKGKTSRLNRLPKA